MKRLGSQVEGWQWELCSQAEAVKSLSHESCGGFCLHTHKQEFCLSPSPEFFMHIKSSFSCAFLNSLYCSPPSLGCSLCNRLQEEICRETYFSCPWVEFPRRRALLVHLFSPLLFFSLDFLFKIEEKLHQGQFSSSIYCNAVCMLGGVLPLTKLVVFSDSPHCSTCGKWQHRQLPEKAKLVATLHPLSHHRCE